MTANPVGHGADTHDTGGDTRLAPSATDRLRALRALHAPVTLPEHHARMRPDYPGVCRTCWDSRHGGFAPWPCPTAQALWLDETPNDSSAEPSTAEERSAPLHVGRENFYEVLAEHWSVFKQHAPAGAYLPVGQLDGDCGHRQCGGSWPCETVRAIIDPLLAANDSDRANLRGQIDTLTRALAQASQDTRLSRNLLDASDLSRRKLVRERDLVMEALRTVLLHDDVETVADLKRFLSVTVGDARIAARSSSS